MSDTSGKQINEFVEIYRLINGFYPNCRDLQDKIKEIENREDSTTIFDQLLKIYNIEDYYNGLDGRY